jgi:hypothetical protein
MSDEVKDSLNWALMNDVVKDSLQDAYDPLKDALKDASTDGPGPPGAVKRPSSFLQYVGVGVRGAQRPKPAVFRRVQATPSSSTSQRRCRTPCRGPSRPGR